jgi:hypothetical protein
LFDEVKMIDTKLILIGIDEDNKVHQMPTPIVHDMECKAKYSSARNGYT